MFRAKGLNITKLKKLYSLRYYINVEFSQCIQRGTISDDPDTIFSSDIQIIAAGTARLNHASYSVSELCNNHTFCTSAFLFVLKHDALCKLEMHQNTVAVPWYISTDVPCTVLLLPLLSSVDGPPETLSYTEYSCKTVCVCCKCSNPCFASW